MEFRADMVSVMERGEGTAAVFNSINFALYISTACAAFSAPRVTSNQSSASDSVKSFVKFANSAYCSRSVMPWSSEICRMEFCIRSLMSSTASNPKAMRSSKGSFSSASAMALMSSVIFSRLPSEISFASRDISSAKLSLTSFLSESFNCPMGTMNLSLM